jgi:hypothetical protein
MERREGRQTYSTMAMMAHAGRVATGGLNLSLLKLALVRCFLLLLETSRSSPKIESKVFVTIFESQGSLHTSQLRGERREKKEKARARCYLVQSSFVRVALVRERNIKGESNEALSSHYPWS